MGWITKKQLTSLPEYYNWTDSKINYAVKKKELKDNNKKRSSRLFWMEDSKSNIPELVLKDEYLKIKIAKERQLLILERLELVELFAELMKGEFFFPLVSKLADIVRQHTNEEGIKKWNLVALDMSKEGFKEFLKILEMRVME